MGNTIKLNCIGAGLIALGLAACSQKDEPVSTPVAAATSKSSSVTAVKKPVSATTTKAVAQTIGDQPIELQFELQDKPVAGQPINLRLNALGLAVAKVVQVTLTGGAHVVINGGEFSIPQLAVGQTQSQDVTLRADQAGITVVGVAVTGNFAGNTRTLNYSIPIAVMSPDEASVASSATSQSGNSSASTQ